MGDHFTTYSMKVFDELNNTVLKKLSTLESKEIEVHVGINPITVTASGVLGTPGVALLYGIAAYQGF